MYKFLVWFGLIFIFSTCKERQTDSANLSNSEIKYPVTVNLGDLNAESSPLKLSEIASKIEYIPLSNEFIIGEISEFQVTDSFIFIEHNGRISSFRQSGCFIGCFPPDGRGPGEDFTRCMAINEKDRIVYVYGNYTHKIIPFSYEGKWLKTSIPDKFDYNITGMYAMGKKLFSITANLDVLKDRSFSLGMDLEDGNLFFKYQNPYVSLDVSGEIRLSGYQSDFQLVTYQTYEDSLVLFRDQYNDTVYQTSDFKQISPRYIFHSDESRRTYENDLLAMWQGKWDKIKYGYRWDKILETSSYLFFKVVKYPDSRLGIYEKNNQTVRVFKKKFIQNDMDGGPDFIPYNQNSQWLYKDKLYNLIWPTALLEHKSDVTPSGAFESLLKTIKEEDNPILMIVTLK